MKLGGSIIIINILIVVVLTMLITAVSQGLYVDELDLMVNNSYLKNVTKTIQEPYNVTNIINTTEEYIEVEEYDVEMTNYTKIWFSNNGIKLNNLMISDPKQGYWSGLVGVCAISFRVFNPNRVRVNFTIEFYATQIDTKQIISRILHLNVTGDLDPVEENYFTQIIQAGEYPDDDGVLANWSFGTCDFRELIGIELIDNNETYFELEEEIYNVTKTRNVTKKRILPFDVINAQPKFKTLYRDKDVIVEEVVQKYDKLERRELNFGKFILVAFVSFLVSIGIVLFINWIFLTIKRLFKEDQERKGILVVKGTKLKLKR